ncbi:MAG TPA: DUF3618 domain-containing protein [Cellulomonas sp.]
MAEDGTAPIDKLQQLEDDVRAARGELAATVDELAGWFDPKTRMTAAVDRGRRVVHDATSPTADSAERLRARVVLGVAAAAVAAAVAGVVGRLTRR